MRRFELSDGKSHKFWQIAVEGNETVTQHGRIGTAGRETRKPFASAAAAEKAATSAIAAKQKNGYAEVDGPGPSAAAARPSPSDDPLAPLLATLTAEPEAYDDWLVYADALAAAGDPRGELITIGVALARGPDEREAERLREREDALLQSHARAWFGKLVDDDDWRECFGWTLQTGFWGRIRVWLDYEHRHVELAKVLAHALAHPSARFVRELDLGLPSADGDADYAACVRALVQHGPVRSLRRLTIGDFVFPDESEISWVQVGDVGRLWPLLPAIEELTLQGGGVGLGTPSSDTLRRLTLRTGGLPRAAGDALGRARLPALEHLTVWFGTENYGGSCTGAQAQAILANPGLPAVRELALANADFADDVAQVVATTALPATLELLDLSMGTMTDAGGERLLANAGKLAHLRTLDLRRNFLSTELCERITAALPNALVADQKTADDAWYYVSVGE